ncbi:MAG: hypothetical protein ABEJ24_04765 [Candidatus Magasanikbacteria bacterium]
MSNLVNLHELLRTDKSTIDELEQKMEQATGKSGVVDQLEQDIAAKITNRLDQLGLSPKDSAEDIHQALLDKVEELNSKLHEITNKCYLNDPDSCKDFIELAESLVADDVKSGFYIKPEKVKELFHKNPPPNVMDALGYSDVNNMLEQEDFWELAASLRFAEDMDWLNNVFFKPYNNLSRDDFEYRPTRVKVLDTRWNDIASGFVDKKLHNVSHLKELGLIFVIPYSTEKKGETLQVFSLILHYFHEIEFYSSLFEKYVNDRKKCSQCVISALQGKIKELNQPEGHYCWQIVQRYLAKEDENDPRLFQPHVNPESLHWDQAQKDIQKLKHDYDDLDLEFWEDMNYVGCNFSSQQDGDKLINMNLKDNAISFVRSIGEEAKYRYHQQEALWNELFRRYIGYDKMVKLSKDNFNEGQICFDI